MADPSVNDATQADADKSARALLASTLQNYGLPTSLANTLWDSWHVQQGKPLDQILLDLPSTPEYIARFPGMAQQRKNGTGMTEEGYIQYENGVKQKWADYGIPAGFKDSPEEIAKYMNGNVSVDELGNRLQVAATAALQSPIETRYELQRLYGANLGDLTAFFLDPASGQSSLEKKATLAAAGVAGASDRSGYGLLSKDEAESLSKMGVGQNAEQGFDQLVHNKELYSAQDASEQDITRQQQLASTFGGTDSGTAADLVAKQAATRKAKFAGGGDFAAGQKGITGLGTAGQ